MQKSILIMLLFGFALSSSMAQNNYESQWKEVESLVRKGLPQSALSIVDSIYLDAKNDNNTPQFLKAALYQIRLKSDYQEDFMESSIGDVSRELETATSPVKNVLYSIRAELYWRYYEGNLHKFYERTRVSNPDLSDIKTWDLQTLVEAVRQDYLASLAEPAILQKIKLQELDPILELENDSKIYRPTLYDFLANRALDFFNNEEPAVIKPAIEFQLDKPEYFAPAAQFITLVPDIGFRDDFKYIALTLYQDLIRFHSGDKDPAALIDIDLARIKFVEVNSILADKENLYLQALNELQSGFREHPNSADIAYEIASSWMVIGEDYSFQKPESHKTALKTAKDICDKTINAYPGTRGAGNCAILLRRIEERSLSLTVNFANIPDQPILGLLSFKNITTAWFRIIPYDPAEDRKLNQKERGESIIANYLENEPLKEWSVAIPDQGDYRSHKAEVQIPALSKGYYIILVADNAEFSIQNNSVAYTSLWVTNISYISENDREGLMEVYVLDRDKGTALKDVTAQAWVREYNYQKRAYENKAVDSFLSDENGYIAIPSLAGSSRTFYLEFTQGDDRFYTENYFYVNPPSPPEESRINTHFFTDRSIYRPGQTVYFKGIMLETTGDKTVIKPDYPSVVTFYDANGQTVAEKAMTTNEFGSFSGSFTAPSGGLTGEMSIRSATGMVFFSVEEYKRPRFKVETDPLEGSYKLNETVTVTGKAMNYNGSAVDQAGVSYRVVRNVRYPGWRGWWFWPPYSPEIQITSGRTTTGSDGGFSFSFQAVPDLGISEKFKPVFNYTVYIDVTDISGEVRSAEEHISVGYQALLLDMDIPEKLDVTKAGSFRLSTTNLNGRTVPAEVKISIKQLNAPGKLIRGRAWDEPDVFIMSKDEFYKAFPYSLYDDENNPETWSVKNTLYEETINSEKDSVIIPGSPQKWPEGEYILTLESTDVFGQKVEVKKAFTVFNPGTKTTPAHEAFWFVVTRGAGEPGDTASIVVGTAEKNVKLLYEIENDRKVISRKWLDLSQEKTKIDIPLFEEYRGNFFVNLVFVKANKSYETLEKIIVPFSNKELKITTETFRDKLVPGQEEEWRIMITGPEGEKVAAELLASMYDASLDAFREHDWSFSLYPSKDYSNGWNIMSAFSQANSRMVADWQQLDDYPQFQGYDRLNWFGFSYYGGVSPYLRGMGGRMMKNAMPEMDGAIGTTVAEEVVPITAQTPPNPAEPEKEDKSAPPEMPLRKNFNETAFFFPALMTDDEGAVILKFKMPESLTSWKFMVLAYTKDLKTGQLEKEIVTRKELMVMTNAPRFFREGDRIYFTTKLVSLSDSILEGHIEAEFLDAFTMEPVLKTAGLPVKYDNFSLSKGNSQVFSWEIGIPEGVDAILVRVKATSGEFADGEEIVVPVLPNRMLVTESLPLPVNGKGTRNFKFDKLISSAYSTSISNYRLTLEFTSNPAWYAVQALPYLTENVHESADALFDRYYANSLAAYIANSNPVIKQVFESWKNQSPEALLSNLEKNQELKAVLLNETPWVMEAKNETERKKRIALLFDLNRMADEQRAALAKLQRTQSPGGGWSWFEGLPDNRHTTQLIVTGIGRLHHLGVIDLKRDSDLMNMVQRACNYLDQEIKEDYDDILKYHKNSLDENHISATHIQYLYAYSYLKDMVRVGSDAREAFDYFKGQAAKYWTEQNKYLQGMTALALFRLDITGTPSPSTGTPSQIMKSLKENALYSDELGMYWRENTGFYWYEAPVERQAILIEAFAEVTVDSKSVEQMKIWLLKQKQTQDWKTSRATADAVYALLLKGVNLLASTQLVEVSLGDETIEPLTMDGVEVQAGTGYFQVSHGGREIVPSMGNVKVVKKDEGIAWGALYWQYYEDLDKITPAQTPLSIEKELYVERNTPSGPVLEPVSGENTLKTGDKLKVRIIIRTDRDMEYVHMKDMRASAFEPLAAISGYNYQDGLGYYESIRDASVNFYFDYLRKGTYVFEYPLNVTQKGEFSNGITTIQCLYAPEFAAHSKGIRVVVE